MQTSEEVKVEAVLELAWFPGGLEGMPCGKEATACNTTLMVAEGREWSGKEILDDSGKRVTYQNGEFGRVKREFRASQELSAAFDRVSVSLERLFRISIILN